MEGIVPRSSSVDSAKSGELHERDWSGNVAVDLTLIADYYKRLGNKGARPELAAPWVFRT